MKKIISGILLCAMCLTVIASSPVSVSAEIPQSAPITSEFASPVTTGIDSVGLSSIEMDTTEGKWWWAVVLAIAYIMASSEPAE